MQGQMDRTRRTALYRLYGESGELVYVGIGFDPQARMRAHAREKPWWDLVRSSEVEWHPNRQAARDAETAIIKAEKFHCAGCGHTAHADVVGAINILRAGLARREATA